MKEPKRLKLANLPTPVQQLNRLSEDLKQHNKKAPSIHIKRDDFSGIELSGNKIRKLEYALKEAKDRGCDLLITCGGIQSNHCRATAAIGAKLGMKVVLLLRASGQEKYEGNYLLDHLLGATTHMIAPDAIETTMEALFPHYEEIYREKGYKPYCIPTGASNGIGAFGYRNCMKEILEDSSNVAYDAIVVTVGSAGTYAGLLLGKEAYGFDGDVIGINISADKLYFEEATKTVLEEAYSYLEKKVEIPETWIQIIDGYQGEGYALNTAKDFQFIKELASLEGLLLDPVYTGKAFNGLLEECKKGSFDQYETILFIHTGGLYGLLAKAEEMAPYI